MNIVPCVIQLSPCHLSILHILIVAVQSLTCVWLFTTPWTAARQASLSFTISQSLLKLMSVESVMPSNYYILCHFLLVLLSIFPSLRVFSSESVLCIWWPKYWSFSFSISSSNKYSRLIYPLGWTDLISLLSQETLKCLLLHHNSKSSSLWHSEFFMGHVHDSWKDHSFFQGIFLTQGSNPGPLHFREILYLLNHQEAPFHIHGKALKSLKWDVCFSVISSDLLMFDHIFCLFSAKTPIYAGFFSFWNSSSQYLKSCLPVYSALWSPWKNISQSVQFRRSVVSDSLWPHESQHARPPCPSPTPRVHSDSCPSSQ